MKVGDLVTASFGVRLFDGAGKTPKKVIQYLPKGTHEITAKFNGAPSTRTVTVEAGIERLYQEDLEALQAENVPPFIDYLHEGGRAAGHPKRFTWDDSRGLLLEVDWTPNAQQVIASRELAYFSPEFLISKDGRPLGLHPTNKPIGGLVSDPAFVDIESVAARRAAKNQPQPKEDNPSMDIDLTKFVELGVLTAEQAKDPTAALSIVADSVVAHRSKDRDSAAQAELVKARKEAKDAADEVKAMKEEAADSFIADAVQAGRIPPKDEETQADLKEMFLADKAKAQRFLDRMAPEDKGKTPLNKPVTKVAAGREDATDDGDKSFHEQARDLVKAGKAKSFSEAYRNIGTGGYDDHRTGLGLGEEAEAMRQEAHTAILQAHRQG